MEPTWTDHAKLVTCCGLQCKLYSVNFTLTTSDFMVRNGLSYKTVFCSQCMLTPKLIFGRMPLQCIRSSACVFGFLRRNLLRFLTALRTWKLMISIFVTWISIESFSLTNSNFEFQSWFTEFNSLNWCSSLERGRERTENWISTHQESTAIRVLWPVASDSEDRNSLGVVGFFQVFSEYYWIGTLNRTIE